MSSFVAADLEADISDLLADGPVSVNSVRHIAVASAGATRSTHFVELATDGDDAPLDAVVQLRATESELEMTSAATERGVILAAAEAGVAVAAPLGHGRAPRLEADALICRRVSGESIPRRVLRLLDGTPGLAETLTTQCAASLAALHSTDPTALPAALPRHDPASYLEHLHGILDELPTPHPAIRFGLARLATLPQGAGATALVHGDFRNGNLLVDATGLTAILDWELAHIGNPMEDLAWLCLRTWRFGRENVPVGGFGELDQLRSAYESAGGTWDDDAFRWWTVARTIWWAAGLASQSASFVRGDSDSLVHAASGRRVVELEHDLLQAIGDS